MPRSPRIFVITGISAAGKSSVAQALAERFPAGVHLRGDVFRRMIVSGRRNMPPGGSEEALRQLERRYEIACMVAKRYAKEEFTVVYQDVILGDFLAKVVNRLSEFSPAVVVLSPSVQSVRMREARRAKSGYNDGWTVEAADRILREQTPKLGYWLDTSSMSIAETVDAILQEFDVSPRA